jgi:membrane protein insertase Oxa1/YidC/SpoIIIJ
MKPLIFKFLKILPVALVMFLSIRMMGFSNQQGIIAALIPIVLGILDLMVGLAFGVTAIIFVIAILLQVFPNQVDMVRNVINQQTQTPSEHSKPQ